MSFADLIPTSFAALGSLLIGLAIVLVLVDMPGGVPWDKIGAWCSLLGGAGVLGGAGGWVGQHIVSGSSTALSFAQQWVSSAIGGAALIVILFGAGAWAFAQMKSKGLTTKGNGVGKKIRGLFKAGVFALVGAALFSAITPLYTAANWAVAHVGGGIQSMIA